MFNIRYEKASPEHLSEIEALEKDHFHEEAFSRRQIGYLLKSPDSVAIVATADGSLVGYIIGTLHRRSRTCNICTFCLQEDFRHRNVASELLSRLEKECVPKGVNRLALEVKEGNISAQKFYSKSGFVESQKLPGYYKDGSTAIKMEKTLTQLITPN
ncbi:MAG: GNAT family N-acetyltransferase [Candidatus Brocadiales bacterium]